MSGRRLLLDRTRSTWLLVLCAVTVGALFILDLVTPLGVAEWILYLLPLLATLWLPHVRATIVIAVVSSVLMLVGLFASPAGVAFGLAATNLAIGLLVLWLTTLLIIQRKRVESALRASEDRYHDLIEHSQDLMCTHDLDGRILSVNAPPARILGYEPAELVHGNLRDLLAPEVREQFGEYLAAIARNGIAKGLMIVCTRTGERRVWQYSNTLRTEGVAAPIIRGMAHDVTERERSDAERRALLEIATDINRTANFDELLDRIQRRTAAILPCDRVVTYCWDEARSLYRAIAWFGIPDDLVADTAAGEFRSGEPIVDGLVSGQTVLINDVANQDWLPVELLMHFRLSALTLVPLVVQGRRLGGVAALNAENRQLFSDRQVRLLELIARQVGIAMEAHEFRQAQQEEASVNAALARIGRELTSLDTRQLLEGLGRITAEVLVCDVSYTLLWQPDHGAFKLMVGHGGSDEEQEAARALRLPAESVAGLIAVLEQQGVTQFSTADPPSVWASLPARFGVTVVLYVPLWRAGTIVGVHAAGFRGRREPFAEPQVRIARAMSRMVSVALENARLMEELDRANRLKSDFIATMSHELRTPLHIMLGYHDLLLAGDCGRLTTEQLETVQRAQSSAEELLELVNATLDLSRLETGQESATVSDVDLIALLDEIKRETGRLHSKPGLGFVWDIPTALPRLHTDARKLKVVLKNLIHNAWKFTREGTITVNARLDGRDVEFSVSDTGAGIGADALPLIFEPFRQGKAGLAPQHDGVGLGLYIVRTLVGVLGGSVTVQSEVDRGSTFHVRLPLAVRPNGSAPAS